MRILFTFAGGTGHFLPLAPVALAAERAGHVVAFAGQEGMVATVEAAGFTAFASGGASLLSSEERLPLLALDTERGRARSGPRSQAASRASEPMHS